MPTETPPEISQEATKRAKDLIHAEEKCKLTTYNNKSDKNPRDNWTISLGPPDYRKGLKTRTGSLKVNMESRRQLMQPLKRISKTPATIYSPHYRSGEKSW